MSLAGRRFVPPCAWRHTAGLMIRPSIFAFLLAVATAQLFAMSAVAQQQPISALTAAGPAAACSGQTIAYDIRYETPTNARAYLVLSHPPGTTFVSAVATEGSPGNFGPPAPDLTDTWSWGTTAPSTSGAVQITVNINAGFVGTTGMGAFVPGSGTIGSNNVYTPGNRLHGAACYGCGGAEVGRWRTVACRCIRGARGRVTCDVRGVGGGSARGSSSVNSTH